MTSALAKGPPSFCNASQCDWMKSQASFSPAGLPITLVIKNGAPWWIGVLSALLVGIIAGAWQGFWVAFVGLPAFIATLAGMLVFRGATWWVLDNKSLSNFPAEYQKIGQGYINGLFGGYGYDVFTLVIFGIAVAGYAFQACNVAESDIGHFSELEHHAPASLSTAGQGQSTDVSQIWAFRGDAEPIIAAGRALLGEGFTIEIS